MRTVSCYVHILQFLYFCDMSRHLLFLVLRHEASWEEKEKHKQIFHIMMKFHIDDALKNYLMMCLYELLLLQGGCAVLPQPHPEEAVVDDIAAIVLAAAIFHFTTVTYFSAIASISQRTPFGRDLTATQLLAGLEVKYLAYTSLNAAKSPISAKKQVVLITLS